MQKQSGAKGLRIYALFTLLFILSTIMLVLLGGFIRNMPSKKESAAEGARGTVIIIDAGHGGEDCGAIGIDGTLEKHINLNIALRLAEYLRSAGMTVRLTRTEDKMLYDKNADYEGRKKALDFARRLEIAQSYEDAIFVSIHLNSFPQAKYNGLQVYYSDNSPDSQKLAQKIQDLTRELLLPNNHRKIKSAGDDIYLLHKIEYPAVLVECGFLSNPEECKRLSEKEYQSQLAFALYCSIVNYLTESKKL